MSAAARMSQPASDAPDDLKPNVTMPSNMVATGVGPRGLAHTLHVKAQLLSQSNRHAVPKWRPRSGYSTSFTDWRAVIKRVCKLLGIDYDNLAEQPPPVPPNANHVTRAIYQAAVAARDEWLEAKDISARIRLTTESGMVVPGCEPAQTSLRMLCRVRRGETPASAAK